MSLTPLTTVARALRQPPRRIRDALADPEARVAWIPGLLAVAPPPGARSAATSWVETRTRFGHPEAEHVIVESDDAEAGRLVLYVHPHAGATPSGRFRSTWHVEPHEVGSRVTITLEAGHLSRKMSVLVRFLAEPWGRQMEAELDALEAWLSPV